MSQMKIKGNMNQQTASTIFFKLSHLSLGTIVFTWWYLFLTTYYSPGFWYWLLFAVGANFIILPLSLIPTLGYAWVGGWVVEWLIKDEPGLFGYFFGFSLYIVQILSTIILTNICFDLTVS